MVSIAYPVLQVPPNSEFEISTGGANSHGTTGIIDPRTEAPYTNLNSSAFVAISNAAGTVLLAQAPMIWTAAAPLGNLPARWAYVVAASVCLTGAGPWKAVLDVYGPAGLADTHLAQFIYTLREETAFVR